MLKLNTKYEALSATDVNRLANDKMVARYSSGISSFFDFDKEDRKIAIVTPLKIKSKAIIIMLSNIVNDRKITQVPRNENKSKELVVSIIRLMLII